VTAVRLLFDEDADHRILRGLRRAAPQIDARSVIDVGLAGRPDREILTWAATEGWLLVTRDVHTMTAEDAAFVESRVARDPPGWYSSRTMFRSGEQLRI
jgi:predicted nuclease of predicted toxin-antitoxin system